MSSVQLKALKNSWFQTENVIVNLDVSHNELTQLAQDIFLNLRKLRKLDMSYNEVDIYSNKAFERMTELEELSLNKNQISELLEFGSLVKLVRLNLCDNSLRMVCCFEIYMF